jgi:type I restriction enzyme, S subunit
MDLGMMAGFLYETVIIPFLHIVHTISAWILSKVQFGDPVMNPKHIPVVKLGELTKIGTGGTPSRKISENFGGDIPWVKTTEVNSYLITNTEERITEIALKNSNCRIYPVGSIIIAMYGQGKTRGQCAVLGIEASTNQACAVLTPNTRYRTNFLFSQIAMSYSRLRSIARGGNQENLNLSLISDFEVLLPSLKFQDEFSQRIEAIEQLKTKHRESLSHLDNLFASLQHRAFRGEL